MTVGLAQAYLRKVCTQEKIRGIPAVVVDTLDRRRGPFRAKGNIAVRKIQQHHINKGRTKQKLN